jgi:hypothetical protein
VEASFVVIEAVETESWGWGGLPVDEYRKQRAQKQGGRGGKRAAVRIERAPFSQRKETS